MDTSNKLKSALREPLVHFLLAGLAVFLLSGWWGEEVDPESRKITIDKEQVSRLVSAWEQTWQRPPTQSEIDALVRDYVREEIYYREARRLGLDENDTVIRRRLRAKMEFLATAEIENAKPSDAVLQGWFDKNKARYATDASYSFDQVYLGQNAVRATGLLTALNAGGDWKTKSQSISLPASLENSGREEIARFFGEDFSVAIASQPEGKWSGPVRSGFGLHLVRIRKVRLAAMPKLADVRQSVENDWRAATLEDRKAKAYQILLDGYTVRIAQP